MSLVFKSWTFVSPQYPHQQSVGKEIASQLKKYTGFHCNPKHLKQYLQGIKSVKGF